MGRLKTWVVLFCGGFLFLPGRLCASTPESHHSADIHYRDSLLRRISTTGAVEMSCYLSYPIGSSILDTSFGNNPSELSSLCEFLRLSLGDSLLVVHQVSLTGYCSPDGTEVLNERLSRERVMRIYDYLRINVPFFRVYPSRVFFRGADWGGLKRLLSNSGYPWASEALRIIDSHEPYERKKLYLTGLDNGRAHEVMYNLYRLLRRVEVKVTYDVQEMRRQGTLPAELPTSLSGSGEQYCDTLIYLMENLLPAISPSATERDPLFALKTNLLFDAALLPNVELELPLGRRWSLLCEYTFPWWLRHDDSFCMEMLQGGLEGRYWFGNRTQLSGGTQRQILMGWFVGGYAGGGYYDFQFKQDTGYQGEFFIAAGVSGGYSCRLSRGLNVEFSLGVGALSTKYRQYEVVCGSDRTELVRQNAGKFFWLGPTKAKVSLVWLLGGRKGEKK